MTTRTATLRAATLAALSKRIDHFADEEQAHWREAWISFWQETFSDLTDFELELIRRIEDGEQAERAQERLTQGAPASLKASLVAWPGWDEALCEATAEIGPGGFIPVTRLEGEQDPEGERPDLARWPHLLPEPPKEPEGLLAYFRAITRKAEAEGVITIEGGVAAFWVCILLEGRAVRRARTRG